MESDIKITIDGFELTKHMDITEAPDFGLLPSISNELKMGRVVSNEYDRKVYSMEFVLYHPKWANYKDELARIFLANGETKRLEMSIFPDRYWNIVLDGDSKYTRKMDDKNEVAVSLNFLVPDGMAHATSLNSVTAQVDSSGILAMDIDYKGTEKTPLTLTIHNNAETGFLGAIGMHGDENTFLTQLGYVDEADGEIREKAQIIIGKDGGVFSNWTDATTFYENQEKAIVAKMPVTTAYGGWMGGIPADAKKSGTKKWYGTAKELILPNPIESAYLWGRAWFETGKMGQTGQWTLAYVDENNLFVAGMAISKGDKNGNSATVYFLINEGAGTKIYKSIPLTPSYWLPPNPYGSQARNDNRNMFDLRKEGEKITFFWNGGYYSVNVPFLKGKKVKRVQFYTGQYADRTPQQAVPNMGLRDVLVSDLKSQYWQDLPNRFSAGSDVIITKENGMNMIYRDGIQTLEDFITGSNFPYLVPGNNHIEFPYSPFTTVPPTITGTYEKRFV